MKTWILLLTLVLLKIQSGLAQIAPDAQWLILDRKGKSDYKQINGVDQNAFENPILITSSFTLKSIQHPNRSNQARAKNDLFIIYDDGTYYSSRVYNQAIYNQNNDPFYPWGLPQYPDGSYPIDDIDHNLHSNHNSAIKYLYLSNIYEGNDPPHPVKAVSGYQGHNMNSPYTIPDVQPLPDVLVANHDVVKSDDITLIIKASSITPGDVLTFNKAQSVNTMGITTERYFSVSNIFTDQTQYCYGATATDNGNGTITFNSIQAGMPFIYVNLRPTDKLPGYHSPASHLDSIAIFELTHDPGNPHQTFGSLTQAIMQSHDPNYIELQRVCKKGGYIYAFYHVEFFNDGLLPADHLSVTFDLPAHLKALCANVNLWNVRGNKVKGHVQLSGKSLNALASSQVAKLSPKESNVGLIFNPVESVDGNNMQDPKRSKGFIEFSLQFDITAGTSPVTKFKLKNCKVNFNQDSYLITKYFMPEDQVNPLPKQVQSCRCSCPQ